MDKILTYLTGESLKSWTTLAGKTEQALRLTCSTIQAGIWYADISYMRKQKKQSSQDMRINPTNKVQMHKSHCVVLTTLAVRCVTNTIRSSLTIDNTSLSCRT